MTGVVGRIFAVFLSLTVLSGPAEACRLALALTVDVSGSIDPGEYNFQVQGLAEALEDPVIAEVLASGRAALMLMQWSGEEDQEISIPWRRMTSLAAVAAFAREVRATKRRFIDGKTAVGDALTVAVREFAKVPDCVRRVIDVSGDGQTNAGRETRLGRLAAAQAGITVNGVAIDRIGLAVTQFYRNQVAVGRDHFVETSRGYSDYPATIKRKLFREVVVPGS